MNRRLASVGVGSLSVAVLLTLIQDYVAQAPTMYSLMRVLIHIAILLGCLFLLASFDRHTSPQSPRSHLGLTITVITVIAATAIIILRLMRARAMYLAAFLSTGLDLLIYLLEASVAAVIMLYIVRRWPMSKATGDDS